MSERLRVIQNHLVPLSCSASQNLTQTFIQPNNNVCNNIINISMDQKSFYETNGYLIIRKLLELNKLELYRQRFEDICSGKATSLGMTIMYDISITKSEYVDKKKAVSKLQDFQWDQILFKYCQSPEIVEVAKSLIGPNLMAMHTMLINKPPDSGLLTSRHPMHQDLYYFPFRPADKVVCSWTAMQKIDRENGCLVVVPKSHKGSLLEHDYPKWEGGVNKMYHGIMDYDPEKNDRIWLDMEAGDTVFFHPLLIHGSGANKTTDFRKSISCHYAASECEYVESKGSNQEKIADEIIQMIKNKTKSDINVSYKDVWTHRARLVAGERINL